MPPHIALRAFARPMASRLSEPLRSSIGATPRTPIPHRLSTRLSRLPSGLSRSPICPSCTLQPGLRAYSTNPPPSKPTDDNPSSSSSSHDNKTDSPDRSSSSPAQPHDQTPPRAADNRPDPALPSTAESSRHALSARFSTFMDNLQSRVFVASQTLNDLTGYSAIEAIKAENSALERRLEAAQARLHAARQSYKDLTSRRASTQREVTTLLARKDSWAPGDLERFTALYRLDHELEAGVSAAAAELTEAEADEDRLSASLNAGILRRYHEEQIWSDRIRRQSTWGTWGLMGVNVLLFLGLQFVAEPWRRRRLVKGIAEGERGVLDELRQEVATLRTVLAERVIAPGGGDVQSSEPVPVATLDSPAGLDDVVALPEMARLGGEQPAPSWKEVLSDPERWRPALRDLYSERRIDLRMRDATVIAMEGAAAGALVAAGVVFMLLRRT